MSTRMRTQTFASDRRGERSVLRWASTEVRAHLPAAPTRTGGARILSKRVERLPITLTPGHKHAGRLHSRWRALSPASKAAVLLLALATLFRLALILRGWPQADSDEAVVGLMARHVLLYGEHPAFLWGVHYISALQSYLAAPVFAVLGSSDVTLHLSVLPLVVGFLSAMYLLGRAAYGKAVGLLVLAWLAFGPPIALLREAATMGGYQDMLFLGALVLLGAWSRMRSPVRLPGNRRDWVRVLLTYGAIGVSAGLGLWSDLLILPILVVTAVALAITRWRELLAGGILTLAFGFILGGYPYLEYNFTHVDTAMKEASTIGSAGADHFVLPSPAALQAQLGESLAVAVPAVLGSPHVCVKQGAIWYAYPGTEAVHSQVAGDACDAVNITFSLGVIAVYLMVAWQLIHAFWLWVALLYARRRGHCVSPVLAADPPGGAYSHAEATARIWLRFMLLGIAAMTLLAYVESADADLYQFTSARYLLPLYLTTPLLFGALWERAMPLVSASIRALRAPHPLVSQRLRELRSPRAGVAAVAVALLLALSVGGGGLTYAHAANPRDFSVPAAPSDQRLLAFLSANHITQFYGDYWICYRLAFESNERVICAVRGQNGDEGLELINNRWDPWVRALAANPAPAYVLPANTAEDRDFVSEASKEGLPHEGYTRTVVSGYAIYYHAP